jgi:hypothetical protein
MQQATCHNLLENLQPADVVPEPFPHVIVSGALPAQYVERLTEEFPTDAILRTAEPDDASGSNRRVSLYAATVAKRRDVSPLWKRFIEEQSSARFTRHAFRIFGPTIERVYPEFARRFDSQFDRVRCGVRYRDSFDTSDALSDAGPSINTPVTTLPSSVRVAHLDLANKLFVGLYYLRPPADRETRGGDLVLCRYKRGVRPRLSRFDVDPECIEPLRTVPYESNVLVLFLNTLHSVHAVTPRVRTPHTRLFVNLLTEVRTPLFDVREYQVPRLPFLARQYVQQAFAWRGPARE